MEEGGIYEVWGRVGGVRLGKWTSKLGKCVHGCGLWRGICMGWEDFSQHTQFEIGLGNRVRFWQNCWCGDQPLGVCMLGI